MFKQRKNFENNIFWNAYYNLREKGLNIDQWTLYQLPGILPYFIFLKTM